MRALTLVVFLALPTSLSAQQPVPRPCPDQQTDTQRLQTLLREKGVQALVDEVTRPQRELWQRIRKAVLAPDGPVYFSEAMDGALVPEMSGYLISQSPTELVLGVSAPDAPDVVLRLDAPLTRNLAYGTRILFAGRAREFTTDPLTVTFDVSLKDVAFLPPRQVTTREVGDLPVPE